jgi:type II secretory pathway pseudopilin PulG
MKIVGRGPAAWSRVRLLVGTAAGFTIVETMIVLAVTGGLFVVIASTLAGRQNEAEFQHSIQVVEAHIQQTIDQVTAGFYPNNSDFSCDASSGSLSFSAGSNTQGTNVQDLNTGCVFLGKVMQFRVNNTDPEEYRTYTVAGLLGATSGAGAGSPFAAAKPKVVGWASNYDTYSTVGRLEYGLTTVWMRTASTDIGAVAFLMEPGSLDANSSNGFSGGKQQVDLIPLPGTSLSDQIDTAVGHIESELNDANLSANAPINPDAGVQICFASGGTNQSGLITIGSSGRQLRVNLDIKSNNNCT